MWINVTTVGDLLDQRAERSSREALVMPGIRMTYPQLSRASDVVAAGLMQLGIGHGDKVGILMPNCASYIETLFGAAKIGAIAVPINARLKAHELRHIITHADLKVLLVATDPAGSDHTEALNVAFPDLRGQRADTLKLTAAPELQTIVNMTHAAPGCLDRAEFEARAAAIDVAQVKVLQQRVRIRDVALLIYTSGTTSTPKGCLLTHEAVVRQGAAVAQTRLLLNEGDVMWNPLPLFHCGGIVPLLGVFSVGAKYCHTGHFEAGQALEMIVGERCTVLYPAFEAIWRAVLDHPKFADYDLSAVRVVMNVATPRLLAEFEARMPWARQISSYGSTECATNLTIARPDEAYDVRIATVGTPVAGMEIKIVDPSTGAELPVGRMGELFSAATRSSRVTTRTLSTVAEHRHAGMVPHRRSCQDPRGRLRGVRRQVERHAQGRRRKRRRRRNRRLSRPAPRRGGGPSGGCARPAISGSARGLHRMCAGSGPERERGN